MSTISAPPIETPLVDVPRAPSRNFYMTAGWYQWLIALVRRIQNAAQLLKVIALTGQAAAIGATSIPLGTTTSGLFRVSWYTRVTQPATTNSSLTVTIGWTESAVVLTRSGAALTGNTVTTGESGSLLLQGDANAAITYATAYVSVGATPMQYRLSVTVELVQ